MFEVKSDDKSGFGTHGGRENMAISLVIGHGVD
jgi:hypothetical protein